MAATVEGLQRALVTKMTKRFRMTRTEAWTYVLTTLPANIPALFATLKARHGYSPSKQARSGRAGYEMLKKQGKCVKCRTAKLTEIEQADGRVKCKRCRAKHNRLQLKSYHKRRHEEAKRTGTVGVRGNDHLGMVEASRC